jgi:mannose-1-phosphate guanylyltransferase
MLQETINRLGESYLDPIIVCNNEHRFIIAEQLRENGTSASEIILEPLGRNTAPAIALAALSAVENGEDPLLLVLAADHVIKNIPAFQQALITAETFAKQNKLVTFGIVPSHPETGYGYIKQGAQRTANSAIGYDVDCFVEKPDQETATNYLKSGEYLWNSGMFMFKASHYLEELEKYSPQILTVCSEAYKSNIKDLDFTRISAEIFQQCPDDSVDYALMEHTKDAVVVPLDAGWSDVGSFSLLWEVSEKDQAGNVTQGDVLSHNTTNSYIHSGHKLVTTVGVDNLVIIETKDALLVANKDKVQEVKAL